MHAQSAFPVFAGMLTLCACAVAPPAGPNVIALPPQGKHLVSFSAKMLPAVNMPRCRCRTGVAKHQALQA